MAEFDNVKYELIKSETANSRDVIRYFGYLRRAMNEKGFKEFSLEEMKEFVSLKIHFKTTPKPANVCQASNLN
jgi:hypothetical protein